MGRSWKILVDGSRFVGGRAKQEAVLAPVPRESDERAAAQETLPSREPKREEDAGAQKDVGVLEECVENRLELLCQG